MSKLNLANLAQNEVTKDEAQKAKGGLYCICYCSCSCPPEYRIDYRLEDKVLNLAWVRDNS